MRPYQSLISISVFILGAFTACKKDANSTPEPPVVSKTSITYYAKVNNATNLGITQNTRTLKTNVTVVPAIIDWTAATIYVEDISFTAQSTNPINVTTSIKKNINILGAEGLAGSLNLPVGTYNDAKVILHLKKSATSDLAFNVSGVYHSGSNIPIVVANSDEFQVPLSVGNVTIKADATYKVTVTYDLKKLLDGIAFDDLEKAQHTVLDNVLLISSSVNVDLYNKVKTNWQTLATATIQ